VQYPRDGWDETLCTANEVCARGNGVPIIPGIGQEWEDRDNARRQRTLRLGIALDLTLFRVRHPSRPSSDIRVYSTAVRCQDINLWSFFERFAGLSLFYLFLNIFLCK